VFIETTDTCAAGTLKEDNDYRYRHDLSESTDTGYPKYPHYIVCRREPLPQRHHLCAVDLGSASDFIILTKAGISNTGSSRIFGDMGVSPVTSTALTGFSMIMDSTAQFTTSAASEGFLFASDYAHPTPPKMGTAVLNMETAYTSAAALLDPDYFDLKGGSLNHQILTPGLYTWASDITITTELTFEGSADDIFVLQINGDAIIGSGSRIHLKGGVTASNIFWQVTGIAHIKTYSHVEGIFLSKNKIVIETGTTGNGAYYAHTAVTLDSVLIVKETTIYDEIEVLTEGPTESPSAAPVNEAPTATQETEAPTSSHGLCPPRSRTGGSTPSPTMAPV